MAHRTPQVRWFGGEVTWISGQKVFGIQRVLLFCLLLVSLREFLQEPICIMSTMSVRSTKSRSSPCWKQELKAEVLVPPPHLVPASYLPAFWKVHWWEFWISGALQTGVGIGIPALMLAAGLTAPLTSFPLALLTGAVIGAAIGLVILLIRKYTINSSNSTFGSDVMMGAGNAAGRYLGPLIVIAAVMASIPVGIGATAGAAVLRL